ncbi:MAG: putative 2-dehydropantoate 2-reductase [Bacteroidaceae bacterium]|nr:putative 2-dehydropantoate 2-reductase [Bacteroidaceae bacterium]
MRYGVIGTGAVGGFYGARLARSGQEVHFLLHRDYEYVCRHGLSVDSCDGSFRLEHPYVYADSAQMPPCDVVLVALKSTNNHMLPRLLPPLLRPGTLVVLIQNGIGVEEDVQQMFPGVALAAGLAFICSAKTEPGRVNHQCYGSINIGNYSCRESDIVERLVDELREAGIEANSVEYSTARWRKAVWNMPFNGMTVALGCQTDELLQHPSTRNLVREQMMEIVHATRAMHIEGVDEDFVEKMIVTTDAMTPYSPSMRLDWDFGRPMELEYIYTRPCRMARDAGCPMPRLEMLEAELRFMEGERGKDKGSSH